jgi:alpha-1,3-rhamnosyl/mannosyltransferase
MKQVVTFYDALQLRYPELLSRSIRVKREIAFRLGDPFVAKYVAISHFAASELISLRGVKDHRIGVVPLGSSMGLVPNGFSQSGPLDARFHGREYFHFPATLGSNKGHAVLLEAMTILRQRIPNLPLLVLTGQGTDSAEMERMISASNLRSEVIGLGFISRIELERVLSSAVALVFPSLYEGFGLPVLESMGLGVPVISSRLPSITEIGGEAILEVKPGDPVELADAMMTLLANPALRAQMSEAGLQRAARYTWGQSVDKLVEEYFRLAYVV